MWKILYLFVIIAITAIELELRPRLDYTWDKKLLLWYGVSKRKFVILKQ